MGTPLFPSSTTTVDWLRVRAREHPERRAFAFLRDGEDEGAALTYAELDLRARAVAAHLQSSGAEPGERALLLYPPSLEFIAAFFGALYAGVVAVPAYPPRLGRRRGSDERLETIAEDCRPRFILTTGAIARRREALETGTWLTTGESGSAWLADAWRADSWLEPDLTPETLAFLQYTSGSTSTPKGVRVEHRHLHQNEEMIRRAFGMSEASVVVGWLPLYHDMGLIGNVLQPIYAGATAVLMSPAAFLRRPARWLEAISRYRGTTSGGPDFAYELCVRKVRPEERDDLDLSSWRVAFNGAEPVRAETLEHFAETFAPHGFDRRAFLPCYGLAEATLFVTGKGAAEAEAEVGTFDPGGLENDRAEPAAGGRALVSSGRAPEGLRLEIVESATGEICPPGRVGEIWLAGPSVAGGYWNRPEASRETFEAVLEGELEGEETPFLRTGDLGFLQDGELFVTGRLKDLIILRGRNHYPQDLEATAEGAHPALRPGGGAAFSIEAETEERLVVVHELRRSFEDSGGESPEEAIRRAVAEVHEAAVWDVVTIEAGSLPKTSSGKVRRRACRAAYLEGGLAVVRRAREEERPLAEDPQPELVGRVRAAAAGVLRRPIEAIRADRPLTAAGLDSLGAVELQAEIEAFSSSAPSLGFLLEGATPAEIAAELGPLSAGERSSGGAEPGPLSAGQLALWGLHRAAPESPAYNLALALRLEAEASEMARALEAVAERHPSLRTVFSAGAGEPRQEPLAEWAPALGLIPAAGWSRERLAGRVERLADGPFDLEREPPLRAHLFTGAPGGDLLLLTCHHLVADLWSLDLVARDLRLALQGDLGPQPPGYADFVAWQERFLESEEGERQGAFWRDELAGDPPDADLPADRPRPLRRRFRGRGQRLCLRALGPEIEALARREGKTSYAVFLTALHVVLHRQTHAPATWIGQSMAGRRRSADRETVGLFVNPVISRADFGREQSGQELLGEVWQGLLAALEHQDLPFSHLVEGWHRSRRLEADPSRPPLFEVGLAWQVPRLEGGLGDAIVPELSGQRGAPYDLLVLAGDLGSGLEAELRYDTDLFDATTIARFGRHLCSILAALARDSRRPVAELPLLGAAEHHQVLLEWNEPLPVPESPPGVGEGLYFLFERRAVAEPDAVAAEGCGVQLSRGELRRRALLLARGLRRRGVGPEVRVALALERGPEFVVASLGVLAAGGAYVPLDVEHPAERRERIAHDAGAELTLDAIALAEILGEPRAGDFEPAPVDPANAAYAFYTSGSTGRPKGVVVTHGAVQRLARSSRHTYLAASDRLGQMTSVTFDASAYEIFSALARGARLDFVPPHLARSPRELADRVAERRITAILLVTPLLEEAVHQVPEMLARLRCVWFGGEEGKAEPLRRVRGAAPETHLVNLYGPTESTTVSTWCADGELLAGGGAVAIGRPIEGTRNHVLDRRLAPVPVGVPGELFLAGEGLARGYLGRPARTAASFLPDPFAGEPGGRLYRTGDLVRSLGDGRLVFLRRLGRQLKIRGVRIEPGEVEAALAALAEVEAAVVLARPVPARGARLVAYTVPARKGVSGEGLQDLLRQSLRRSLPAAMIPEAFVFLDRLPLTSHAKVDRASLAGLEPGERLEVEPALGVSEMAELETKLSEIWREVLGVEAVGPDQSFFDLGGHSLALSRVQARLEESFGRRVPIAELFEYPTIRSLAAHLEPGRRVRGRSSPALAGEAREGREIAIVGLACRFPGAGDAEAFWRNLRAGAESISRFSEAELEAAGVPAEVRSDPRFVPAGGVLEGADLFDAGLFGLSPAEAALLDPQQRVFLECAWRALDEAGYGGAEDVGVFAGMGENPEWSSSLADEAGAAGLFRQLLARGRDFLPTRTSHLLGLGGPSVNVQSACSTSLMAVHLASQSLLAGECELALAGGVAIRVPQTAGYRHEPGMILSPEGRCRAFDARATGTVGGNGVGVVVLKPLGAALADGDPIRAVVRASKATNDGARRVGFTAPGVDGQRRAIAGALAAASIDAESVGYVEAHGTGTEMGDPIEVAALDQAFREQTERRGFCALGSVKTNIGHLDAAAGIAGLIKTVLALEHGEIPPSLHFEIANPEIDFAASPFFVNRELRPWPRGEHPRRAGVSSFGMGGTNVHAILEEAPPRPASGPSRPWQLLALSARSPSALETMSADLAVYLRRHPRVDLADVAYTLQVGRRALGHRRVVVASSREEALEALSNPAESRRVWTGEARSARPSVAFLIAGLGDHYPGLSAELYREEAVFRAEVDRCAEILHESLGWDLRTLLFPEGGEPAEGGSSGPDLRRMLGRGERKTVGGLERTALLQPALFTVEFALAKLWMSWGIAPGAILGYSLGEWVAATLAGVFSLEDALRLVAERARRVDALPAGGMMAVGLSAAELEGRLGGALALAAINGPEVSVVAGPTAELDALEAALDGISCRRLGSAHAFHTPAMEPAAQALTETLRGAEMRPPRIPYLSNLTGTWITAEKATDAEAWARHLCRPVRFADVVAELSERGAEILVEIGPGQGLSSLFLQHPACPPEARALPSLPPAWERRSEQAAILEALGRAWIEGVEIDAEAFWASQSRHRLALPAYPFEHQRFAVEVVASEAAEAAPRLRVQVPEAALDERIAEVHSAPLGETEERLAELWRELLGVERVGVGDSFFEAGGHSLLAIQLMTRVGEVFGVEVALADFFADPTVAHLAELLEASAGGSGKTEDTSLPEVVPRPEAAHEPFPLTEIQEAYWLGRRGDWEIGNVGAHAYLEIETPELDPRRFTRAWRRMIERHPMLRMVIRDDGRQEVLEAELARDYTVGVLDLRGLAETEAPLLALRAEMSHRVHRTDSWPLFENRLTLLDGRSRFHFSFDVLLGDAWSLVLLDRDLWRFYEDPELEAEPLELTFRDYVLALEEIESGPRFARALEYWRHRLETLPPAPELPLARDPATLAQPRFVRRRHRLGAERWRHLQELAQSRGLTPTGLLLAVFAEVLATWSRGPRFTLTLTLFNRHAIHPQINDVVGDFTSLILLEADATGRGSFEERSARIQDQLWRDLDHRWVSGVRVLRELGWLQGRAAAAMPVVFTSGLGLTVGDVLEETVLEGPERREVYGISQTPQVWIDHQVYEEAGELVCNWDAVEELFAPGVLDAISDAWARLVEALARDGAWAERPRLVPVEHLELVAELAASEPLGAGRLLHELVAERTTEQPDAPAVISAERSLDYGELLGLAGQLARRLRSVGVRPGELVAVSFEKGWRQVVAVLGVVASGAAYVPIDPALPRRRRQSLFERCEVRFAVTRHDHVDGLEGFEIVEVPETAEAGAGLPESVQGPDELAYVIFTSGSTGEPKGVMIDHRGAVNTLLDVNRRFGLGPGDRVLALSSLSFDLSVWDVFGLLAAGGAVVLPEPWARREPGRWLHWMEEAGVTVCNSVPALMEMLAEHCRGRSEELPRALRLVLLSGDWIPLTLPGRLRELFPRAEVVSLGGATEASIWSILHPIGEVEEGWRSIPYGRPMRGQSIYVLGPDLEPRPPWVTGEIYIGGAGLAHGYWDDPELSRESFPHHPQTGERLYRTGDLGRYMAEGAIEFLGREDHQVKVRGHRVELGEIETALAAHPGAEGAVVLAVGDGRDRRLAAYLLAQEIDPEALRRFLGERLPAYMVPGSFISLESFPLSSNGKVDRRALEKLSPDRGNFGDDVFEAPRDDVERALAKIWCELLELQEVGIHQSFFELGGHSLTATRLASRVRESFGAELPLAAFFNAPTIAELAPLVAGAEGSDDDVEPKLAIHPVPRDRPLALSFAQERLWFLQRLEPGSTAYSIPAAYRLVGDLRPEALALAFEACVARHETLRTTFGVEAARPVQVIAPEPEAGLVSIDLTALGDGSGRAAHELLETEAARPFALDRPLVRAALLRLDEAEHLLFLNLHHVIADAWSLDLLRRELVSFYADFASGRPASLEPLEIQYADFADWQRRSLAPGSPALEAELDYWRARLGQEPPALELPFDHPRPVAANAAAGREEIRLAPRSARRLDTLGRRHRGSLFMVLAVAYLAFLRRLTGQSDLAVGTPIAGRGHRQIEDLIGFFVNTLVLRAEVAGQHTFEDLLEEVRELALGAFAHQEIPFEKLVEVLRPSRDPGRNPFFQALFALQEIPGPVQLEGLAFETRELAFERVRCDLELHLWEEAGGGIAGHLLYAEELFDVTTARRMASSLGRLMEGLAERPELPLGEIELLGPGERHQLLVEVNDTGIGAPWDSPLAELFEAQAAATPDAVALVCADRHLSYSELARSARALAARLEDLGVGLETPVAISAPRGPETIVGILAILRAGGAYVPLDPEAPPRRQRWIARELGIEHLLTLGDGIDLARGDVDHALDLAVFKVKGERPCRARAEGLAYVLFTSGSTGTPKGVAVPQRAVVRLVMGADYARLGPGETLLQMAPLSFDASTFEIWGTLLRGGRLAVMPPGEFSFDALAATLGRQRVSTLWLTSAVFEKMVDERPHALAGLRQLLAGGDVLSPDHAARALGALDGGVLINGYGPTECTTFACTHRMVSPSRDAVPIGRPIVNTRVYAVDGELRPVPRGAVGELLLGGEGLARGYLGRPGLSAERFVPDPFGQGMGGRLYRTGDQVRMLADGTLNFLGRRDQQLKLRGFRIEPGEVESALVEHPAVRRAVVLALGGGAGGKRLVAWISAEGGARDDLPSDLRHFLAERLPAYMVPSAIVPVAGFPLTASGKVDRRELARWDLGAAVKAETKRPMSELEAKIAEVCRGVLGAEALGPEDNFFDDLGAHSLLLATLQIRLRERGFEISVGDLFQFPSVAGLAKVVERRAAEPVAQGGEGPWPPELICLREAPGSAKEPLFLLHALGGHVFFYRDLVESLPEDQPVYAVQARGLGAGGENAERLEELVEHYLEVVLHLPTRGPYYLAGCSLGGILAFEMARQMVKKGLEVAYVGLMDSPGPGDVLPRPEDDAEALERFYRAERPHDVERFRRLDLEAQMREYIEVLMLHGDLPAGVEIADCLPILRLATVLAGLAYDYRPEGYSGPIHFYRAATRYAHDPEHPEVSWIELSKGATVHLVPGDHVTMMRRPQVEELGKWLRRHLEAGALVDDRSGH